MNVIEKILAAHCGKEKVRAGEIIDVGLDYIMSNDATTTLTIDIFNNQLKGKKVFSNEKVIFIMDHYTPSSSVSAADNHNVMRDFARKENLKYVYDGVGVCHQLMLENHICPGHLVIGADSHTCTYGAVGALATGMGSTDIAVGWLDGKIWMKVPEVIKVIVTGNWPKNVYAKDLILKIIGDLRADGATYKGVVFEGEAIDALSVSKRATLCNMGIEMGAKFAYIQPDQKVMAYMKERGRENYTIYTADEDASYERILSYNINKLEPQIAAPYSVDNVYDISKYEGLSINELFLGACTNGRYEDLEIVATILKGKKVAKDVRFLVTPASRAVYLKALENGVIKTLMESGCMISNPGCSACFGGTVGLLGKGERLLTTANRNFKGRVGSDEGEIFLATPAVVATSAITGVITRPQ